MKIILSNYRYFISGGPEKYMFAIQDLLQDHGHDILPFSVNSSHNFPCDHQEYFLSPIAEKDAVYFYEYKRTLATVTKVFARQFYCPEAFFKARSFAQFTGADIVYSLQFLNKMSPALLDGFKTARVPVVLRVSDFGLICPQAHLFDGKMVCEKCLDGNFFHAMAGSCVMGSKLAGFIKGSALWLQRLLHCHKRISLFAFPCKFTLERFAQAGFPRNKLFHLPTFIDTKYVSPQYDPGKYILYFGRLVQEKGVHHLLEAYRMLPVGKPKLIVIGAIGNTPYAERLMNQYKDEAAFHDFMCKEDLIAFIRGAICIAIPSIWYDNLPNVLLEAYAYGKPVIAPKHGSFLELIIEGKTGLFYEPGDTEDLQKKLLWAIAHPAEMAGMGRAARALVERDYSPIHHYRTLMTIFNRALKG